MASLMRSINSLTYLHITHLHSYLLNYGTYLRYAVAEWYGAGLAIARSWVRIPHVAVLCTNANSARHPYGVG